MGGPQILHTGNISWPSQDYKEHVKCSITATVSSTFAYSEPIPNIINFCYSFLPSLNFYKTEKSWKYHAEILVQENEFHGWIINLVKFNMTGLFFILQVYFIIPLET